MDNDREFYVCGGDCDNCPDFENCFMTDEDIVYGEEEDIEELETLQNSEDIYDDSDLLDQEFEDRISGDCCDIEY